MNSILMSIRPKWIEKIASGEKTVEVRKSVPKCGTPFKVYMYCTNDRKETLNVANGKGFGKKGELYLNGNCYYPYTDGTLNGKVVGEFVCDKVFDISFDRLYGYIGAFDYADMGLVSPELQEYAKGETVWGLHISDLKIYDKPKELSEFRTPPCEKSERSCEKCKYLFKIDTPDRYEVDCFVVNGRPITRSPQSWQYVEEL